LHLPLRYEDETHLMPIADAPSQQTVLVEGVVSQCEVTLRPRKQLLARIENLLRNQSARKQEAPPAPASERSGGG